MEKYKEIRRKIKPNYAANKINSCNNFWHFKTITMSDIKQIGNMTGINTTVLRDVCVGAASILLDVVQL